MSDKYSDAMGYLYDLADKVNEDWFTMVCDIAVFAEKPSFEQQDLDTLFNLYVGANKYEGMKTSKVTTIPITSVALTDYLESISDFNNFKLLPETLQIVFAKPITLVFGANGSGKSSICEAIKVLASPQIPRRPLHNVRVSGTNTTKFNYKFRSDTAVQTWEETIGYGSRSSTLKYFDSGIAIKNITDSVEPGRVIELTPFKLHVFEWVKELTTRFRERLQQEKQDNAVKLGRGLEEIRAEFAQFKGQLLSTIDEKSVNRLETEIKVWEGFTQYSILEEKKSKLAELEKATSEVGLRLLKAERNELEKFLFSIGILLNSAEELWMLQPVVILNDLTEKLDTQESMAKELIPENGTLEAFRTLLHAALPLIKTEEAGNQVCPLCKRELSESEIDLFRQYQEFQSDILEKEVTTLRANLAKAKEIFKEIYTINPEEWVKNSTIPTEFLIEVKANSELIIKSCGLEKKPTEEAKNALNFLKTLFNKGTKLLGQKTQAIETATLGKGQLSIQLADIRCKIEPMEFANLANKRLEVLKEIKRMAENAAFWDSKLPLFTTLLKKITDASKNAYTELIVSDFEIRLNAEYIALTEKPLTTFGVKLARKGSDASVTVLPQIGGKEIERILSEGEQRVHALALFFAELETCPHSVIIFDDPISSFDYNYIANYCTRLRDFRFHHPDRQIIVLTHNWEFFVQFQTTINQAEHNSISVQVLENCTAIGDYSEKVEELKTEITFILSLPGEPINAQKEQLAGKMRRLIEAIINTHVFNKQRHQYKQKSQAVSDFRSFTKIVPLEHSEARTLQDLYARLSINEHDDPRNAYVNTDKAIFQSRYNKILELEAAIISRKHLHA